MKNNDLRVIKTKKNLFDTIIKLMKEKSFEEIKVSDICQTALITRSTFYSHYEDKYELVMDFVNHLEENIIKELEKNNKSLNTNEYYIEAINLLIDYLDKNIDIYRGIFKNNRNSILLDIISNSIEKDINKRTEEGFLFREDIPNNIVSKFYMGAVTNILISWLQNDIKYSKKEIIQYLNILIPNKI